MNKFWNSKSIIGLLAAIQQIILSSYNKVLDKINTFIWKYNFSSCGNGTIIQSGITVRYPNNIKIGNKCNIGRNVSFGTEILSARLIIGDNTYINRHTTIDFSGDVIIGNNVVISDNVKVLSHSHGHDPKSKPIGKKLIIEDNVWIGTGATISESVNIIRRNSIVAAGAFLTKDVEENTIVGGCPAKFIKNKI